MVRIRFSIFILFLLGMSYAFAQQDNCRNIVLPMFGYDEAKMDEYPDDKLQLDCAFSRNGFYVSDTIPTNAAVYEISDVVSRATNEHLPSDYVVNLKDLSYYAYNFHDFRYQNYEVPICFRTPGSAHPYLVLRTYIETFRLTYESNNR
ncbi:MAG: hypothetical protein IJU90_06155 [Bacteroidales bacterium]|nr:hypothetical protein [Bacteroidales bacterium]